MSLLSSPLGTFRQEGHLRVSDKKFHSDDLNQCQYVNIIYPVVMWSPTKICSIFGFSWSIMIKFCVLRTSSSNSSSAFHEYWLFFPSTVEPPWATTNPKHQNFPSQSLTIGTSSKRPSPVRDRDHFLGLTVNDFPWFLTSCKRPLDTFSDLYFRWVHYVT